MFFVKNEQILSIYLLHIIATNKHKIAINDKPADCKSHKMITMCDLHAYTMCIFLETEYERFS